MTTSFLSRAAAALLVLSSALQAALVVPGADGSDGALTINSSTEIDLSQAVTAAWDANNSANAGKGVYDASKWAVVFKYTNVTVAAGATVTFKNHPSRAPVVWLVSGNVTINGTVSANGRNGVAAPELADAGPGGFRGGQGQLIASTTDAGSGFGPAGGATGSTNGSVGIDGNIGAGGGYGTSSPVFGSLASGTYGNPSLVPLLGGSGGGGDADNPGGGGGGGGALLIACPNAVTIAGQISANGGSQSGSDAGGASGGGIRIVSSSLLGGGVLNAVGGSGWNGTTNGGLGRIRLERVINNNTISGAPSPSVISLVDGATALLWPTASAPKVEVISIGGVAAPADPRASFGTFGPDIAITEVTSTPIVIRTTNVEQASVVKVRVTPRTNANFTEVSATVSSVISPNPLVIDWAATLPVAPGSAAVQVRVIRP